MTAKGVVIRVLLYVVLFFCLLTYMLLQGSQYDWMEPGAIVPHIEDSSNNRGVVRGVAVAIAIFIQCVIYMICSRKESVITSVLLAVVIAVYW